MLPDSSVPDGPSDVGLGAYACDGVGGCRPITLAEAAVPPTSPEWHWIHLNYTDDDHQDWLRQDSGLDGLTCDALLAVETRPRLLHTEGPVLVILRGVNLNPGADPDDMVSLRIWVHEHRVITLRSRRLYSIQEIRKQLLAGQGPRSPGAMLSAIAGRLLGLQAAVVNGLEEEVDDIESGLMDDPSYSLRLRISEFRRKAIGLRRYIAPQREVLTRFSYEEIEWLGDRQRGRMREAGEQQTRLVEELDAARERAGVVHEELNGRLSEQMNRNMYVLAVVTGVFLPLGLLTGLLGINVGGMPGVESPYAFWVVCAILAVVATVMVAVFRRTRLL
ncbi:MAG: zinc transporter [Planctomycetota bacterium]|jgi:zinc transporter